MAKATKEAQDLYQVMQTSDQYKKLFDKMTVIVIYGLKNWPDMMHNDGWDFAQWPTVTVKLILFQVKY